METAKPNPWNKADSFAESLQGIVNDVEKTLDQLLPKTTQLDTVMRYGVLNGGKRFRPFLTLTVADLFSVPRSHSLRAAAAVEMVHSYSLIHDDLPAMDDANLRRGKPSCHVEFNEASAILAGDSLIPLSFEILGSPETHPDPQVRLKLINQLATSIGPQGMALGQMMDLGYEGEITNHMRLLHLEALKTGELMAYACVAGGILGEASESELTHLHAYGSKLGLLFQIVDDILDEAGDVSQLGKPTGQDQKHMKTTFLTLLGQEKTQALAKQYFDETLEVLTHLPGPNETLAEAAYFALSRAQ